MSISVLNTDAGLSAKTVVSAEGATTVTGLITFDRDPSAPFAVTASSAVVTNLDADKLDGNEAAAFLLKAGGTMTGNLLFTDATLDIGASGATRPRDLFLSRNATIGGTLTQTGVATFAAIPVFSAGVGTIATGTWQGTAVAIAYGGTGAATANANVVFAGPASGSAAAPSFRALVDADLPSGAVLQVVSATYDTQASTASTTYADTGLTASITPGSTANKILVIVQQAGCVAYDIDGNAGSTVGMEVQLMRDTTALGTFVSGADAGGTALVTLQTSGHGLSYVDSPASVSALTYKTQYRVREGGAADDRARVQHNSSLSSIVLMELVG